LILCVLVRKTGQILYTGKVGHKEDKETGKQAGRYWSVDFILKIFGKMLK